MRSFREALGTYFPPWAGRSGRFGEARRAVLRAEAVLFGGGGGRTQCHLQQGAEVVVAGQAKQELLPGGGDDRDLTAPDLAAPEVPELHLEQLGLLGVPRHVGHGGVGNRDFGHGLRGLAFGLVRDQDDDARSGELTVDFVHRWVLLTRVEKYVEKRTSLWARLQHSGGSGYTKENQGHYHKFLALSRVVVHCFWPNIVTEHKKRPSNEGL